MHPHPRRDHTYCVGQLAILQAGGAYVPLHTKLPLAEARYVMKDSGCRQAVVHPRFLPALAPDLRALGVEVVELGADEGEGLRGLQEEGEEVQVEFVEGGPVRPETDAMVVYTRYVCVQGVG